MFKPDFGKSFFQKHQSKLVALANTWLGRRFFGFKSGFGIGKDFRVMALYPNAVSGNWKIVDGKLIKRTIFSTDNHYQMRLERAWKILSSFVPQAVAWKMLSPQGALSLMPLVAMTVFNPDADPETTSVDGTVRRDLGAGAGEAWSTLRSGAGNSSEDNATSANGPYILSDSGTDVWRSIYRVIVLFDTSSIPDTDTISAATLSVYSATDKTDNLGITPDINVYSSAPASNTALANSDYGNTGTTAFSTAITYAGWTNAAYNDFALNASGLAAITATGVSKFSLRNANYDVANVAPTWSATTFSRFNFYRADNGTNKPKLDVTHTAAAPDPSVFDTVTVAEDITMMVDENPNVNDAVTVTEAVTIIPDLAINLGEDVTVSESIMFETIGFSVSDDVAVAENITMDMDVNVVAGEDVAITESVSMDSPIDLPGVSEDVAVTESVTVMIDLNPSINDAVTVTDTAAAAGTGLVIAAARDGLIRMRSTEQSYPLMMDEDEVR